MHVKDKKEREPTYALVEKCLQKLPDCFQLVVMIAYRTQELVAGSTSLVETTNQKEDMIALKEISQGVIDLSALETRVVQSFRKNTLFQERS